jgi:hypothetical protein
MLTMRATLRFLEDPATAVRTRIAKVVVLFVGQILIDRSKVSIVIVVKVVRRLLHRWSLATGDASRARVATFHTCPARSIIRPTRSPQNVFVTGISILAPAATARSITVSKSST